MKKNLSNPIDPDDEIRAQNDFLKTKLEQEYGMTGSHFEELDPKLENEFLRNIYEFERQYAQKKRVRISDRVGAVSWKKIDELQPDEVGPELRRLSDLLEENGVSLHTLATYDDATIYRFLTEELMNEEIDDVLIPGMTTVFIYEEFHPNHEYDISAVARTFSELVLEREWGEYSTYPLAESVELEGETYSSRAFNGMVAAFRAHGQVFSIVEFSVDHVRIDDGVETAKASGSIKYTANFAGSVAEHHGLWEFDFKRRHEAWRITNIRFPGLEVLQAPG